jgi:hypothetical protein
METNEGMLHTLVDHGKERSVDFLCQSFELKKSHRVKGINYAYDQHLKLLDFSISTVNKLTGQPEVTP